MSTNTVEKTPPPEEHVREIQRIYPMLQEQLADDGSFIPRLLLYDEEGGLTFILCPFDGDDSKNGFATYARLQAVAVGARLTVFCSEAWTVSAGTPEALAKFNAWREANPEASFESYEDHGEIVMVNVETDEGRSLSTTLVDRSSGAPRLPDLDPNSIEFIPRGSDRAEYRGRFSSFLPPPAVRADESARAVAKVLLKSVKGASEIDPESES